MKFSNWEFHSFWYNIKCFSCGGSGGGMNEIRPLQVVCHIQPWSRWMDLILPFSLREDLVGNRGMCICQARRRVNRKFIPSQQEKSMLSINSHFNNITRPKNSLPEKQCESKHSREELTLTSISRAGLCGMVGRGKNTRGKKCDFPGFYCYQMTQIRWESGFLHICM